MSRLPKLKVRSLLYDGGSAEGTEIDDLEQVKSHFAAGSNTIVVVEGRLLNSYDELTRLVAQDEYKDRESLEIMLLPLIEGG